MAPYGNGGMYVNYTGEGGLDNLRASYPQAISPACKPSRINTTRPTRFDSTLIFLSLTDVSHAPLCSMRQ